MPRKRISNRPSTVERQTEIDDDDYLFEENSGRGIHEPQQRNAANARERARMRVLSKAFCRLKTTLPWVPADTKLSKLDTLRLAASYIAHLRALLQEEPRAAAKMFPHPLNLAWPFAFQHGSSTNATSPRWTADSPPNTTNNSSRNIPRESPQNFANNTEYNDDYNEGGYREINYGASEDAPDNGQFCSFNQYKDKYFAMRNTYVTSNLMNNV